MRAGKKKGRTEGLKKGRKTGRKRGRKEGKCMFKNDVKKPCIGHFI